MSVTYTCLLHMLCFICSIVGCWTSFERLCCFRWRPRSISIVHELQWWFTGKVWFWVPRFLAWQHIAIIKFYWTSILHGCCMIVSELLQRPCACRYVMLYIVEIHACFVTWHLCFYLAGPGGVGGASSFRFCLLYCSFVLRVFRLSVCLCFLFVVWCFLVWMTSDLVRLGGGARRRRAWRRRVAHLFCRCWWRICIVCVLLCWCW